MSWVWVIGMVWLLFGGLVGILIGRGIHLADRNEVEAAADAFVPNFVVDAAAKPAQALAVPQQASAPAIERLPSARRPDRT